MMKACQVERVSGWRRPRAGLAAAVACLLSVALTGCAGTGRADITPAAEAYARGEYTVAYERAQSAWAASRGSAYESRNAYLAGLAAYQLGRLDTAERYLARAAALPDREAGSKARAALGLTYDALGRTHDAIIALTAAARSLTGDDRAQALFHAAVSQQRLGRWREAQANLSQALTAARATSLRQRIAMQARVVAFTVQVGSFQDHAAAQRHAANMAPHGRVTVTSVRLDDGSVSHRVQVGAHNTFDAAERALASFTPGTAIVAPLYGDPGSFN